jgi:sec-independent protein translocase protein TatA
MFGLGTTELLLILVVIVLLFGANKLPQLGEALGKGIRSFRKASDTGVVDVTPDKLPAKDGSTPGSRSERGSATGDTAPRGRGAP